MFDEHEFADSHMMSASIEVASQKKLLRKHVKRRIMRRALRQLSRAFKAAESYVMNERRKHAVGGRGTEYGIYVLQNYMPTWFQSLYIFLQWEKGFLNHGEVGFWNAVDNFDVSRRNIYARINQIVFAHLDFYKRTLGDCEMPETSEYFGRGRKRKRRR